MGVAPIGAIQKVLERAGMTIDDVDTVELNEAFAAQVIPIMDECEIPLEKLNPHGGAIALGPPVRHDRRADHDHAAQRPRDRRPDDRPRDHVRGRRPGPGDDRGAAQLGLYAGAARRRHEAADQLGQPLGLVLRAERERVLDPLEPRVGQQGRRAARRARAGRSGPPSTRRSAPACRRSAAAAPPRACSWVEPGAARGAGRGAPRASVSTGST